MGKFNQAIVLAALAIVATFRGPAAEEPALVEFKVLAPAVALEAAQAALNDCRGSGFQVAVTVVDRFGITQVVLRDRFAGPHTVDTARRKAWSAVSFRTDTLEVTNLVAAGQLPPGLSFINDALIVGGGVQIEAAGSIVGGIGVSGAPGGEADEVCARAGIAAIADKIAF